MQSLNYLEQEFSKSYKSLLCLSMLVFWVATPCGLLVDTNVSEEHTASMKMEAVRFSETLNAVRSSSRINDYQLQ
jgi:hypothetical protein